MKIVTRYILREHAGPFVAALGVLTGLMLLNQLAKRFGDLVGKGLPWHVIAKVFGLSVPFIVALTLPMAVLVAVLYTFSRLTGDNEITAFRAGGVSLVRLTAPLLVAALALAAGMVWFNDRVLPESNHSLALLLRDIARKQPTFELRERVVNEVADGKLFLQAARIDRMRSVLRDLVIFDQGRPNAIRTIYADSGYMAFNRKRTDLYLTLFDGSMHELDVDHPATAQTTYYRQQVVRVAGVTNELESSGVDWRGDREMNIAMMRDRVRTRTERLLELRDSLTRLAEWLDPVREREGADPEGRGRSDAGPGRTDTAATPHAPDRPIRKGALGSSGARSVRPAPAAARGKTAAAASATRPGRRPAAASQRRSLRRRFTPSRATEWPPAGDPVSFAARVRSRFQRIASQMELDRRERNKYEVEIQKKFAIPVASIVFVLIGVPVAIRFARGGIGMVIGVSLVVFCVYYIFLIAGEHVSDRGILSPFWAMWTPNVIFTVIGLALFYTTARGGTRRPVGPDPNAAPRARRAHGRAVA